MESLRTRGSSIASMALALLFVSSSAWAMTAPVDAGPPWFQPLAEALRVRLAELGELPTPSRAQVVEAAELGQAVEALGAYEGEDHRGDLQQLQQVAAHVGASGTFDQGVWAGADTVRDHLDHVALLARQDTLNDLGLLSDPEHVAQILGQVAAGDDTLAQGWADWRGDPGGAASTMNTAIALFRGAADAIPVLQLEEAAAAPNDARITALAVSTLDPQIQHEFAVEAELTLDQPLSELTLALRAALQEHVVAGPPAFTQVTLGEVTLTDLPAGATPVSLEFPFPVLRDEEHRRLEPVAPRAGQGFGRSLALSDTTMVVGSDRTPSGGSAGWAAVLERDEGGLGHWGVAADLVWSDFDPQAPYSDDGFGFAVAISGDTIVVGAPDKDDVTQGIVHAENVGAVYVFERDAGGPGAWGQVAKLVADPPDTQGCGLTQDYAAFGFAVAISGETLAVGAPGAGWCDGSDQPFAGEVYLFERDAGGAGAWGKVARLRAWDGGEHQRYGYSLALDGNHLAIGMGDLSYLGGSSQTGRVYWHVKTPVGWDESYVARLQADDGPGEWGAPGDGFGVAVALSGDRLVVGAPREDLPGGLHEAGAAYVYDTSLLDDECGLPGNDCAWIARLTAADGAADDGFGSAVGILHTPVGREGVVVGAPRGDYAGVTDAGATYVFHADLGGEGAYGQLLKITTDGEDVAYVADHMDGFSTPDPGDPYALFGPNTFGAAVAVDGEQLVVGAPLANHPGVIDSGAAWIFPGLEFVVAGDYAVAVEVDPHDRVLETAGPTAEDNLFLLGAPVPVGDEHYNQPNLTLLAGAEIEPDVILWEKPDPIDNPQGTQATLIGLDIDVLMTGKHDAPLEGVRVTVKHLEQNLFAGIWDADAGQYVQQFELPPMFSGEPRPVHLDIALPPPPPGAQTYDATLGVALVSPEAQYDPEDPDGNGQSDDSQTVLTGGFVLVELPQCTFSKQFSKSLGNDDIGASVDFVGTLDVTKNLPVNEVHGLFPDSDAVQGALASVEGDVDVLVMGHELELVKFRGLIERDPVQHYGFFGADLLFLNPITDDHIVVYSAGPVDTDDLDDLEPLPEGFELCDGESCEGGFQYGNDDLSFEKTTNDKQGVKKSKTYYPGGVPVTVEGFVTGKVGFAVVAIAADEFSLEGKPFASLTAGANLEVGNCDYLCIGAGGEVDLVKDEFRVKAGIGMTIVEDQDADPPYKNINANMCFRVANELTLLSGKLYVFATYPWLKWCSTFFGSIPCGFTIKTSKYDLVDWTAFLFCSELVNKYKAICCEPLEGGQTDVCGDNGINSTVCGNSDCSN